MRSLSVSVVTYQPDMKVVQETLDSLRSAISIAQEQGVLGRASVSIIDNGPGENFAAALSGIAARTFPATVNTEVISGYGNIGYGAGHNLSLLHSSADYHLILNPDVTMEKEAVLESIRYADANANVVMIAPFVHHADSRVHLCKRYPSVFDLFLRGFAPALVKWLFAKQLAHYEMLDMTADQSHTGIQIISGSFMFCRREAIGRIGGFSNAYFLYFEDFDLSLRAAAQGMLAFVPTVRIHHAGGNTAHKGIKHVAMFLRSAWTFFNCHGWKLV